MGAGGVTSVKYNSICCTATEKRQSLCSFTGIFAIVRSYMNISTSNLDAIADSIRAELSARDAVREKVLPLSREAIRYCSLTIRAVHRLELDKAEELLQSARSLLSEIHAITSEQEEFRYSGFTRDAEKEFAEASITLALVKNQPIPGATDLSVEGACYLNGMGEAVGELRRFVLDGLRRGDFSRGEDLLDAMDHIYSTMVTIDFPDAITHGLRRTTDSVRGILEKTRGDLTLAVQQKSLEGKLAQFESHFTNGDL